MPRALHVVVTDTFAGVERYVATTGRELATRGWDVAVVGGAGAAMAETVGADVVWASGADAFQAARSVVRLGRFDVCHVHMTLAELVGVATRPAHRGSILSTRHFAARRGSLPLARRAAPLLAQGLTREIAVSQFVADRLERPPAAVIPSGVCLTGIKWRPASQVVLVLQRLEPEKNTITAIRAWQRATLAQAGWSLRVVGDGSERASLERLVETERLKGVTFAGWSNNVEQDLAHAGMLLAPGANDSLGLSVLEAMAAGVPVVACRSGGHLETIGLVRAAPTFEPGDAAGAAEAMQTLMDDDVRHRLSVAGLNLVESRFSITAHVDRLVEAYGDMLRQRPVARRNETVSSPSRRVRPRVPSRSDRASDQGLRELIVCSLEPWDDVWRRNQFLVDILLRRNEELRVLFVEPPTDPIHDVWRRQRPAAPRLRNVGYGGRLRALTPLKPLPRRIGSASDAALRVQVRGVARVLRMTRPTLWINDVTYAPLIQMTNWPSVYDVTDDWLAAPFSARELMRLEGLEHMALRTAGAVTVCSPALAASRGRNRAVTLIPNAVDVDHFRRPRDRPADLPRSPVALYAGTLHESRLDVDLVTELARSRNSLNVVLVGPNALSNKSRRKLMVEPNVTLLGSRHYHDIPAYLQHADVIVVPHLVNDFTSSLDPIKAYECLAVDVPTVATPVAGFQPLDGLIAVASRERFGETVVAALGAKRKMATAMPPRWEERATEFQRVLLEVGSTESTD